MQISHQICEKNVYATKNDNFNLFETSFAWNNKYFLKINNIYKSFYPRYALRS